VLAACRALLDGKPASEMHPRREGDPPVLVASAQLANRLLGWRPAHALRDCIESAVAWHRTRVERNAA
jgi:UDP-glucose 4-epimerase